MRDELTGASNLPALSLGDAAWSGEAPDPLAHPALYDGVVWRRVLAYLLDALIILAIVGATWIVFVVAGIATFGILLPLVPVAVALVPLTYNTLLEGGPRSATFGMRLFDLEVRAWTGNRPGYGHAFLATALFYATIAVTGFLILVVVFFTPRRRTLHDYLSGTVVIRRAAATTA